MALSEAKKAADKKHMDKLDNIMVRPYKEEGAAIRAAAAADGMSVQAYVLRAVRAWMDGNRAGVVPADTSPAVSPAVEDGAGEGTGTQGAGVMVFSPPVRNDNSSSRLSSLTPPDSSAGLDAESTPRQESFVDIIKRLGAMPKDELERQLGVDPEGMERYRQQMERKRQRLAELNAKVSKGGGLSRGEDAERRRLMADLQHYDLP